MAEEIQEAVQIIRVAYEGIEIAIKIGDGGLALAQQIIDGLVDLLDREKLHGKTNVKKLLQKGGDLQVFQFNEGDLKKVEKLLKKYGVLYSVLPDLKKKDGKKEILFHSEAVPRINMIAQKLVNGRIGTYEEYVKGEEVGKTPKHTEQKEKVSVDLLEKLGGFATKQKTVSVEEVKKKFKITAEEVEKILEQLVALSVLKTTKEAGKYEVLMKTSAFQKKMKEYRSIVERAGAAAKAKNPNLIDITISEVLVADQRKDAIKTRVPGTWGENVRYLWTAIEDMASINDGKTYLSTLDPEKEYKLYDDNDKVVQVINGRELYAKHYDPVANAIRERYEKEQREERERRRKNEKAQGKGKQKGKTQGGQQSQKQGAKPSGKKQGTKKKHPSSGKSSKQGTPKSTRRR